jgi:hypothetical protein
MKHQDQILGSVAVALAVACSGPSIVRAVADAASFQSAYDIDAYLMVVPAHTGRAALNLREPRTDPKAGFIRAGGAWTRALDRDGKVRCC